MQQYTSKDTSINTVNKVYKSMKCRPGSIILDYGGGKYDSNRDYMKEKGASLYVYDPFNRSKEHNNSVVSFIRSNHGADIVVCSNVLNVIKEEEVISDIVRNLFACVKTDGKIYIQIYEGNGSGVGEVTKKGYQRHEKTAAYVKYLPLHAVYARKGNILIIDMNRG